MQQPCSEMTEARPSHCGYENIYVHLWSKFRSIGIAPRYSDSETPLVS